MAGESRTIVRKAAACFLLLSMSAGACAAEKSLENQAAEASVSVVQVYAVTFPASLVERAGVPEVDRPYLEDYLARTHPTLGARDKISKGSGFFITPQGDVATNNHVVEGADRIFVHTRDGRRFKATLAGVDAEADLALLKVDHGTGQSFVPLKWGNSAALRPGESVFAIGNPYGFGWSVNGGQVSGERRSSGTRHVPFLQTDVAINPGNSGGPLLNSQGEVVGVNTKIYSTSGGFMGISLAIPSSLAKSSLEQLQKDGKVVRGSVGAVFQELTPPLAEALGLPASGGAVVVQVTPAGPAQQAGLRSGDVVFAVDGQPLRTPEELGWAVGTRKPGDALVLQRWRPGGQPIAAVHIELGKEAAASSQGEVAMIAAPSGPRVRAVASTGADVQGLRIVAVLDPELRLAGLYPGDIILSLEGKTAQTAEMLDRQLQEATRPLLVQVLRGKTKLFLALPPPSSPGIASPGQTP